MIASSRAITEQVIGELREVMKGLRPPALDDLGLTASVRQLVTDLEARSGISAELHAKGADTRLPSQIEVAMFRIAQESLANVEHHSGARSVIVRLTYGVSEVRLSVEDDGCGFDPPELGAGATGGDGQHLGIIGMTERASLVGGRLELSSAPGQGSRVVVTVPTVAVRLRP
jgi:signal transduction histidine kinase